MHLNQSQIKYNGFPTLLPQTFGPQTAAAVPLDWIIGQYQIPAPTNEAGITNDPNRFA
jgi:predicted helicase